MKKLCILQIASEEHNSLHKSLFNNIDFYYITYNKINNNALGFYNNYSHSQIRREFTKLINTEYEYYLLLDENIILNDRFIEKKILDILNIYNPPICDFKISNETNITNSLPFETNYNIKIIHHSLYNFIYDCILQHSDSSREFFYNILTLPYIKYSLTIETSFSINSEPFKILNNDINAINLLCGLYPYYNKRYNDRYHSINLLSHNIHNIEEYFSYTNIDKFIQTIKNNHKVEGLIKNNWLQGKRNWVDEKILSVIFDMNWHILRKTLTNQPRSNILAVIGNGPSLKEEYFDLFKKHNIDTFALNSAYRFIKKDFWEPKYFGCFDYALTQSHADNFMNLINDDTNSIEKFFLIEIPSIEAKLNTTKRYFTEDIEKNNKFVGRIHNQDGILYPKYGTKFNKISCTGCNAIRTGIELGYEHIILIGHDANYVNPEYFNNKVTHLNNHVYKFSQDIEGNNPNYFWKDYQQKGDIFNHPGGVIHIWNRFGNLVKEFNNLSDKKVKIYNCSDISKIECFEKREMNELINEITK